MANPYSRHLKTGEFTWFYTNYHGSKDCPYLLCFQWLCFQGSEFHLEFKTKGERDKAFYLLKEKVAPIYSLSILDGHTTRSRVNLSVDLKDTTLTPVMLRMIFPTARIVMTPTGLTSREFYQRELGIPFEGGQSEKISDYSK